MVRGTVFPTAMLKENRNGLIMRADRTRADGHAERKAAHDKIHRHSPGSTRHLPLGTAKGCDSADPVVELTDRRDASQIWLNDVARLMNGRPRKTVGWKTPAEAMAEEIRAVSSTVALDV